MSLHRLGCLGVSMDTTSFGEITSLKQHNPQESIKTICGKPTVTGRGGVSRYPLALLLTCPNSLDFPPMDLLASRIE